MIIDCISDLHGYYPQLPGGDLLIIAGDLTASDLPSQYLVLRDWVQAQKYDKKVFIAGNHDGCLESGRFYFDDDWFGAEYLCDSGCEFGGFKLWGSPWTPEFCGWHFMKKRGAPLKAVWDKIPKDTDILITHGPALGTRDRVTKWDEHENVGCAELAKAVKRIKPKLHVFGHVHDGYGLTETPEGLRVNASHVNEQYGPANAPIRVIL